MRFLLMLITLVGCDEVFRLDEVPPLPSCPVSYTSMAGQTAQYRLVQQLALWDAAEADCVDDAPGATHLVVFESEAEQSAVRALADPTMYDLWVGYVRQARSFAERTTARTQAFIPDASPPLVNGDRWS